MRWRKDHDKRCVHGGISYSLLTSVTSSATAASFVRRIRFLDMTFGSSCERRVPVGMRTARDEACCVTWRRYHLGGEAAGKMIEDGKQR